MKRLVEDADIVRESYNKAIEESDLIRVDLAAALAAAKEAEMFRVDMVIW